LLFLSLAPLRSACSIVTIFHQIVKAAEHPYFKTMDPTKGLQKEKKPGKPQSSPSVGIKTFSLLFRHEWPCSADENFFIRRFATHADLPARAHTKFAHAAAGSNQSAHLFAAMTKMPGAVSPAVTRLRHAPNLRSRILCAFTVTLLPTSVTEPVGTPLPSCSFPHPLQNRLEPLLPSRSFPHPLQNRSGRLYRHVASLIRYRTIRTLLSSCSFLHPLQDRSEHLSRHVASHIRYRTGQDAYPVTLLPSSVTEPSGRSSRHVASYIRYRTGRGTFPVTLLPSSVSGPAGAAASLYNFPQPLKNFPASGFHGRKKNRARKPSATCGALRQARFV